MRQILIDEISPADISKLSHFLENHARPSSILGLYWVEISPDLLDPEQAASPNDHPFCFAVEVGDSWAKFEFLIRSRINIKSENTRYANPEQVRFILDYCQRLIESLNLRT